LTSAVAPTASTKPPYTAGHVTVLGAPVTMSGSRRIRSLSNVMRELVQMSHLVKVGQG